MANFEEQKKYSMFTIITIEKVMSFLGVFFGVCIVVIGAIMVDLWDGVYTAKFTKKRVHSHKLRVTVQKMSEYWRFVIIGFLIDCIGMLFVWYGLPYLSLVFGVGLVIVEIKSMFEHAKRRKSCAMELPELLRGIVECASEKDAKKLLEFITSHVEDDSKIVNSK